MVLFGDMAVIFNSVVSNSYYGMLRGQISLHLPPKHPIKAVEFKSSRFQNGRRIAQKVHSNYLPIFLFQCRVPGVLEYHLRDMTNVPYMAWANPITEMMQNDWATCWF